MSTYYYLYDEKEKSISPILHARQTWGSWTSQEEELNEWLKEHRDNKPYVIDENMKMDLEPL